MALPASDVAPPHAAPPPATADLRAYVFGLFFIFGGITSLNDVLIPKLKSLFSLSYFEVMLVQFAFFAAYFLISMPGAALLKRFGHMRTAVIGLCIMAAGCLLFLPAAASGVFITFLAALFTLAAGITIVQVVANPLISMLGPPASAPSRLTFAQAFNSLGTTIFPLVGSALILGSLATVDEASLSAAALTAFRAREAQVIADAYLWLAIAIAIVAGLVFLGRNRLAEPPPATTNLLQSFDLLARPRFGFGALGIFVYVGAEVSIGSLLVGWLMQADTLALAAQHAGEMVAFYWGGAMVGRFLGAGLMRVVPPHLVLLGVALGAIVLVITASSLPGPVSGYALIAVGLMNAIMFPTIFSLACEGLGGRSADGSGIINVAIVGGAVVPLLTGQLIDQSGSIATGLLVPAACYVAIAAYGWATRRPVAA